MDICVRKRGLLTEFRAVSYNTELGLLQVSDRHIGVYNSAKSSLEVIVAMGIANEYIDHITNERCEP